MKTKITLAGVSVFFYVFFSIPSAHANVIISEFSIGKYIGGKSTSTNGDDFIELYNTGDACIPLEGWRLRKRIQSGTESPLYSFKKGDAIMPSDFLLWVSSKAKSDYQKLADVMPTPSQEYALSGNNSVALLDGKNTVKDAITFGGGHVQPFSPSTLLLNPGDEGSIERNLSSLEWNEPSSTPNPTGSSASVDKDLDGDGCQDQIIPEPAPDPSPQPTKTYSIRLNEVFSDPSDKGDSGEFIELYNFGSDKTDISGWEILDAAALKKKSEGKTLSKSDRLIFPNPIVIDSGKYLVATDIDPWFSLTLNNTNETLSLFDTAGTLIDSFHFDRSKSDISLNYTPGSWRGGVPTPGATNQLNSLPETKEKVPKKGYRGVVIDFDARGKDSNHDKLKYTWDFGDGHKSYKERTTHTYEENGTYTVTLKTSDNKGDVLEMFALKIESFPRPEVRITSLMANPAGSDADKEWLMIENREKKPVNLKGFSIATGWKNLSNHPIREDFLVKGKSEAKLTRAFSLFTLPNQKGKIELRAPDGKVLQKIKYKLEKSITDNIVYQKKKGEKWKFEEATPANTASSDISTKTSEVDAVAPTEIETNEKSADASVLGVSTVQETDETNQVIVYERDQLSFDPNRPLPRDILAYGTRVQVPDDITLIPLTNEKSDSTIKSAPPSLPSTESLFSEINASLNEFLNAR